MKLAGLGTRGGSGFVDYFLGEEVDCSLEDSVWWIEHNSGCFECLPCFKVFQGDGGKQLPWWTIWKAGSLEGGILFLDRNFRSYPWPK